MGAKISIVVQYDTRRGQYSSWPVRSSAGHPFPLSRQGRAIWRHYHAVDPESPHTRATWAIDRSTTVIGTKPTSHTQGLLSPSWRLLLGEHVIVQKSTWGSLTCSG